MAPKLTLVYFNLKGRAECIRLLLHYANVPFIDRRIEFADWSKEREEAPNQTLPYIEYQGNRYGEALPIARFLARKFKLLGNGELEQFECDILINHVDSLRSAAVRFKSESLLTEQQKRDLEKDFKEEKLPKFLQLLEDKLASNVDRYLVGKSISFVDLLVFDLMDRISTEDSEFQERLQTEYPLLGALAESVASAPQIKTYLDTRPETFG